MNAVTPLPDRNGGEAREFQLNVDGQQVSADIGTGGQAKFSAGLDRRIPVRRQPVRRDDGPLDRRAGERDHQVGHATSCPARSAPISATARFNAENPVLGFVEPIQNQQYSTTLGGPIVKDKLHYFGNYEYEREPRTSIFNSPYPVFNKTLDGQNNQKKGGIRLDYQLSSQTRLMGKFSKATIAEPFGAGNTGFTRARPAPTASTTERRLVS